MAARAHSTTFVAIAPSATRHVPPRAPFSPSASPGEYSPNEAENALSAACNAQPASDNANRAARFNVANGTIISV